MRDAAVPGRALDLRGCGRSSGRAGAGDRDLLLLLYPSPRQERRQGLALGGVCLQQPAQPALVPSLFWVLGTFQAWGSSQGAVGWMLWLLAGGFSLPAASSALPAPSLPLDADPAQTRGRPQDWGPAFPISLPPGTALVWAGLAAPTGSAFVLGYKNPAVVMDLLLSFLPPPLLWLSRLSGQLLPPEAPSCFPEPLPASPQRPRGRALVWGWRWL